MKGEFFDGMCTILVNMPRGTAPAWNAGVMQIYLIGLRNIPDEATGAVIEAIIDRCTFRPTVHEIVDLYREISRPHDPAKAQRLVGELLYLRDRHGEYVVPNPDFPRLLQSGEPDWTDPIKQRIIATFGGWVHFCRDDSPDGVIRGQLLKVANAVIEGEGDETINRLRIEYRQTRAELGAPGDTAQIKDGSRLLGLSEITATATAKTHSEQQG